MVLEERLVQKWEGREEDWVGVAGKHIITTLNNYCSTIIKICILLFGGALGLIKICILLFGGALGLIKICILLFGGALGLIKICILLFGGH